MSSPKSSLIFHATEPSRPTAQYADWWRTRMKRSWSRRRLWECTIAVKLQHLRGRIGVPIIEAAKGVGLEVKYAKINEKPPLIKRDILCAPHNFLLPSHHGRKISLNLKRWGKTCSLCLWRAERLRERWSSSHGRQRSTPKLGWSRVLILEHPYIC